MKLPLRIVPLLQIPVACALFALIHAPGSSEASGSSALREEGAIYLEDFVRKPLRLQTREDTVIYYDAGGSRYLGTLRKGQWVELQAIRDNVFRVRGKAQQGGVAGWVDPSTLTELQPEFLANLKKNAERVARVRELIARNEVAINMTPSEVLESLGKPQRKSARLDAGGKEEVWEYVRYERVPRQVQGYDRFGNLVVNYIYVKEPVGQLAVIFQDDLVSALEQSEGTLTRAEATRIVAPPLTLY